MADTDYRQDGATSIISMLSSIVAALGFEITDNAKAAVTMLKMQKEILENASLRDFLTGNVTLKTIQNISTGVWYVPGKLVHFVQQYLASELGGGYPEEGGIRFHDDIVKIPEGQLPKTITINAADSKYTVWEIFKELCHKFFGVAITYEFDYEVWKAKKDDNCYYIADGEGSWMFKPNVMAMFEYSSAGFEPSDSRLKRDSINIVLLAKPGAETYNGSIPVDSTRTEFGYTYTYRTITPGYRAYPTYDIITYRKGNTKNVSKLRVATNATVESNSHNYGGGIAYKMLYDNVNLVNESHMYLSTEAYLASFQSGGGITRGGGTGRPHGSLPKGENFPPCGGDTTVPEITQWSNKVINWKGECYMPLTYYKVNPSNENPGIEPGSPSTPIEPDDPRLDPESPVYTPSIPGDIIKYFYPNDYVQSTPQNGDNTAQTTGQLKDNHTNSTNGPSDIPSTDIKGGLYTLWHPSADNLQKLGAFLYGGTTQGTIASIIGDPINAIIQLTEWAVTPVDGPVKSPVICNICATELKMPTIPNQFMQFDCGTIEIPREYHDFRDYEPYTRLSLFLPFVGDVNISTNDCITPNKIHVIYNIDFLSGVACAEVLIDEDVRYAYQAAMCAAVPVTSSDASRLISSIIGAAVGTVGGGVMGGIVGGTTGSRMAARALIGGASEVAMSPINGIQIQRTGSISANTGLLGEMKPYILVTRPISVVADQYKSLLGQPYQLDGTLGSQKGFVKVREVHLDGVTATETEKNEIERLLKEGVIL